LDAKCHVVEDSDTSAWSATRRWVTALTPSRATIRTVAATIASRRRSEASARRVDRVAMRGTVSIQVRTYLNFPRPSSRFPPRRHE
jgi:hypothetical protein